MVLAAARQVRATLQAGRPSLAVLERVAAFDDDRPARDVGERGLTVNDFGNVCRMTVAGNM